MAEKLETILSRNITNTRARDFYDLYLLYNTKWDRVRQNVLKEALIATAVNRGSLAEINDYKDILNDITASSTIISSWERYKRENAYARGIRLIDVFEVINTILQSLQFSNTVK